MRRFHWLLLPCCLAVLTLPGQPGRRPARADLVEPPAEEVDDPRRGDPLPAFGKAVAPVLRRYCAGCHGGDDPEGQVALDALAGRDLGRERPLLARVAAAFKSGRMPPAGEARPGPTEAAAFTAWLDRAVSGSGCSGAGHPGRVTLRRLNRAEYNNTVRDLVGLDLRPADGFPADDTGLGFDTIGDVLSLPPILLEKYLAAAERIVEEASRSPAAWRRLMEPPADTVPFVLRGHYPLRSDGAKGLGAAPGPEEEAAAREIDRAYDALRSLDRKSVV